MTRSRILHLILGGGIKAKDQTEASRLIIAYTIYDIGIKSKGRVRTHVADDPKLMEVFIVGKSRSHPVQYMSGWN